MFFRVSEDNQITYNYIKKPDFLILIENNNEYSECWTNGTYQNGCYNCENFTTDGLLLLKNAGYKTNQLYGKKFNGTDWKGHTWGEVTIPIEFTTGEIISMEELNRNYKED